MAYRRTRRTSLLPQIAIGILVRYAAPALRHRLATPEPGLRLAEDLGLDSLDRLQAVMLLEEVLQVRVDDGLLPDLRTLGDVLRIVTSVARGNEMEPAAG